MIVFWSVVALLLLGALLMVLPPLWRPRPREDAVQAADVNLAVYRDQLGELQQASAEGLLAPEAVGPAQADIERRALEEIQVPQPAKEGRPARRTAWALALLLPAASVLTYLQLGDPGSIGSPGAAPAPMAASDGGQHSVSGEQIEGMVANLAQRLKSQPEDAEGWMMLGRSYTALGRYPDAVLAFRRAVALAPGDPTLLSDFADVLGMAQGRRLAGEPAGLVQQALDIDPRHVKALALAGSAAFEARDYAAAQGFWERLIAVVPTDSDIARSVRGSIAQARQLDEGSPGAQVVPDTGNAKAPEATSVSGEIRIAPDLLARIAPGDTLFVFARAVEGPRMPLAIARQPVGEWPRAFRLDDSMAMAPELRLSGFGSVSIGVRISRSGDATPRSGDLIGQVGPVAPGGEGIVVVVDRVQP